MQRISRSQQLWQRARKHLAAGVSSNIRLQERPAPLYFSRGQGSRLFDVDGNEYIDYVAAYGPLILGHSHPDLVEAVQRQVALGQTYGGQHEIEVDVAEKICDLVPAMDVVRFCGSGSEANHALFRLARAYTGRTKIVRFEGHYHGWLDDQIISDHPHSVEEAGELPFPQPVLGSKGQLPHAAGETLVLPWNDLDAFAALIEREGPNVAAVITEPIMCNGGFILPQPGFLEGLREVCTRAEILLIFDEVITGFRAGLHGAQGLLGVTPDLVTLGKAVANGFPLSVFGGRRDIMALVGSGVMHGGTYNGNPVTLAAANATLDVLARDDGAVYEQIRAIGRSLMDGIRQAAAQAGQSVLVQGIGPVFFAWFTERQEITSFRDNWDCDEDKYAAFQGKLIAHGVRAIPSGRWYVSAAHTAEDVRQTVDAVAQALREA